MTMYVDETPFKIVNVMLNIIYYEKNNENKIWQILKLRYVQNVAMFKKKEKETNFTSRSGEGQWISETSS